MMRPVGNLTNLVPGRTNSFTPVALVDCEPLELAPAKTPFTKEASCVDSRVLIEVPSCSVPVSVIAGLRSDSAVVLGMAVSNYLVQHSMRHPRILQFCQRSTIDSAHKCHAFQPPWWSSRRSSNVNIRSLIPLGREPR